MVKYISTIHDQHIHIAGLGGGGGATSHSEVYGETLSERSTFYRLKVYESQLRDLE